MSKTTVIYEVALTGDGQNFFTLYRSQFSDTFFSRVFIQNLATDFDEAVIKARQIAGTDESTEVYEKRLVTNPDEAAEIIRLGTSKEVAENNGIFTFGKHRHEHISDVFVADKKYVEWVAKGGNIKDQQSGYWNQTIGEERGIRQHAIALLVGNGDWIERQGKFMPVVKAQKLDFIDSLTPDTTLVDKQRVKSLKVRLLTAVYYNEGHYGTTCSFKMVDENNHIIHANVSNNPFYGQEEDAWIEISFTANLYNGKVYAKRILVKDAAVEIKNELHRMECILFNKKEKGLATSADLRMLDIVVRAADVYYPELNK